MRITKQTRREAKGLFAACAVDGQLASDRVRQAVELVLTSKPRGYLAVLTHFERLIRLEIARRSARVETAVSIPAQARAEVDRNLARLHGPGLEIVFADQPSLIGGMRIQVGSDVYDGSIQGRLTELAGQF